MTPDKIARFRKTLVALGRRIGATSMALEETARSATGGEDDGGLSHAPMHLGDMGSEMYTQELNATLLENEEFIRGEVNDALGRIERGEYGVCEHCRTTIIEERLDALPYARYCVPCAEKLHAGADVNLNYGRPSGWGSTLEHPNVKAARKSQESSPSEAPRYDPANADEDDTHAAGTPGGGSALGGLAGTNLGGGDPNDANLEAAMGSADFDQADEGDEPEPGDAYSGPSGGAVGGSPANKRSTGGKKRKGPAE